MSNNITMQQGDDEGGITPPQVVVSIPSYKDKDATAHTTFRTDTTLSSDGEGRSTARATSLTSTDNNLTSMTFVDYRQPPSVRVLPPAKYKLWMIVFVLVYTAIWCSELAGFFAFLRLGGWLSPGGAQFLGLYLIVCVMVYAGNDLIVAIFTITWRGRKYGVGPWLMNGRTEWVQNTLFSDSFPGECLTFAIHVLEDGFGMFNTSPLPGHAPSSSTGGPKQPTFKSVKQQFNSKIQDRDRSNHNPTNGPTTDIDNNDDVGDSDDVAHEETNNQHHNHNDESDDGDEVVFTCPSDNCQTILKIEHHLNPDKMQDYGRWKKRVQRAVRLFPGFVSSKEMDVVSEELNLEDCIEGGDIEKGTTAKVGASTPVPSQTPVPSLLKNNKKKSNRFTNESDETNCTTHTVKSNLQTVYVTFDNIDSLNDWMLSPRRRALMKQLEPMLAVPSHELIQAERARRDAFTALATQQGAATPVLPPLKWKVWWLTTIALSITLRWVGTFLPYYLEFWGLDEKHPRLQSLVSTFIVTFLNSYVCVPFVLFLFAPWLVRKSNDVDERPVWKVLNDGIPSIWLKGALAAVYYGGCILTWALRG